MRPAEIVNLLLANFDIALIRRSSLDELLALTARPMPRPLSDSLVELKEITGAGFASTESRFDALRNELIRQQISAKWELVDHLERLIATEHNLETCPLCNHEGATEKFAVFESQCIFGGGRLTRLQCPECDVIFGAKKMFRMTSAELTQDYEAHYKVFQEGDSTEQEIRAFHLLRPIKEGIYLNYGAGAWSKSVQTLRGQGWNVLAFEPHDSAAPNLDYLIKSKADLTKMKFDGIFSNNVLEHLRHPVEELFFMKDILKPNARLSHATPCFEYLFEYTRFHLFFFLGRSRATVAAKAGLKIDDYVVDGEFMNLTLMAA